MQDFFKSGLFKVLVAVVASLVGLLIFEASIGNLVAPEQIIGMITKPFSEATTSANDSVSGFFDQIFQSGKYKEENELLRDELANLQKKIVDYEQLKGENERLKEAADIKSKNPTFEVETAHVIARDPDDLYTFTINAGSLQGIEKDSPVITKRGLVGIVTKVAETYSKVTTILGLDIQVSAINNDKNEVGVVSGRADLLSDGLCVMLHLDKDTHLEPEDIISTAGGGGLYPSGVVIGKVKEIRVNDNGMSSYAVIEPTEDINAVRDVIVVKNFSGQKSKQSN